MVTAAASRQERAVMNWGSNSLGWTSDEVYSRTTTGGQLVRTAYCLPSTLRPISKGTARIQLQRSPMTRRAMMQSTG